MFKRRSKQSEDEFDDYLFDDNLETFGKRGSLPASLKAVIIVLVIGGVLLALGLLGYQFWRSGTPVYAAEDWFDAMWAIDSERVLDRTCDQEIWVSNAVASGASLSGLVEYLDVTQIPGLDELLVPGVDLDGLKEAFEIDRSRIEFAEVMNDGATAVVTARGQLRLRVFQGWYPYRLDETWLIVQEDERWKWCGQQP
ncbi:MAG TPA: hypothetical protein PLD25_28240 [Chloroflexota bacterium]|nr:hypothetical protein [Chloroflexota bacterium]HUM68043.1 hypothetical protein [Chloroflexota bacterium]